MSVKHEGDLIDLECECTFRLLYYGREHKSKVVFSKKHHEVHIRRTIVRQTAMLSPEVIKYITLQCMPLTERYATSLPFGRRTLSIWTDHCMLQTPDSTAALVWEDMARTPAKVRIYQYRDVVWDV